MYGGVELGQVLFTGNREGQVLEGFHCSGDLSHIQRIGTGCVCQSKQNAFSKSCERNDYLNKKFSLKCSTEIFIHAFYSFCHVKYEMTQLQRPYFHYFHLKQTKILFIK